MLEAIGPFDGTNNLEYIKHAVHKATAAIKPEQGDEVVCFNVSFQTAIRSFQYPIMAPRNSTNEQLTRFAYDQIPGEEFKKVVDVKDEDNLWAGWEKTISFRVYR